MFTAGLDATPRAQAKNDKAICNHSNKRYANTPSHVVKKLGVNNVKNEYADEAPWEGEGNQINASEFPNCCDVRGNCGCCQVHG